MTLLSPICHFRRTSQLEAADLGAPIHETGRDDEERICEAETSTHPPEEVSLRISPIFVLVFVVLMCTMLVLLYFFFDKLGKGFINRQFNKKPRTFSNITPTFVHGKITSHTKFPKK